MERIIQQRRVVWYSIIRYISNVVKGEIINIGIVMNIPSSGEVKYQILTPKNSKFKAILNSKVDEKTYKLGHDVFNHILNSVDNNNLSFGLNPSSETFINQFVSQNLPKGFVFSDVRFAKSSNVDLLFNNLLEEYVGSKFLNEELGSNSMVVKKKAIQLINKKNNLDKLIKKNIKIKPVKELPKSYSIDFGYKFDHGLEFIQSAPDKITSSYDWLERMSFITDNYYKADKFTLVYNSLSESNIDGTLDQMINYLTSKDERVIAYDIFSTQGEQSFNEDLIHIEKYAQPVEELEKVLA